MNNGRKIFFKHEFQSILNILGCPFLLIAHQSYAFFLAQTIPCLEQVVNHDQEAWWISDALHTSMISELCILIDVHRTQVAM